MPAHIPARNHLLTWIAKYNLYLLLILIAFVFMQLLRIATPYGPGLINDSIAYVAGARSILAGLGYSEVWLASDLEPITHYPPLFSLILAFVGLFHMDPLVGARAVNILILGANIVLIGMLGWKIFNNKCAGLLLAALFAINGQLFEMHSYALSEPAFLFFCLASFYLLFVYFAGDRKKILLVAMGLTVGLSILDRYVGLALFATIGLALFLFEPTWRSKMIALGVFLIGSMPLPLAWMIYTSRVTGVAADRPLEWHPVTIDNIQLGIANLSQWLLPLHGFGVERNANLLVGTILLFTISLALLIWLILGAIRALKGASLEALPKPLVYVSGAFAWIYLLSVLASISLFDPTTKFQDRILVPVYMSLVIVFVAFIWWLWRQDGHMTRVIAVALAIVIAGLWSMDFYQTVSSLRQDGQGYASRRIRESAVIKFVEKLPNNVAIYTDSPPSIYSGTGRASYIVFMGFDDAESLSYLRNINQEIRNGRAILVLFDASHYDNPVAQANYQMATEGVQMIVKFGTQRAFMGEK